jgi:hypothetical protein
LAVPPLSWTDATVPLWRTPLEHLVRRGHRDRLARLDDLNSLALIRHDAGQLFELPKAVAQCVN